MEQRVLRQIVIEDVPVGALIVVTNSTGDNVLAIACKESKHCDFLEWMKPILPIAGVKEHKWDFFTFKDQSGSDLTVPCYKIQMYD